MKKIIIFSIVLVLFGAVFYKISLAPEKSVDNIVSEFSTSTASELNNTSSSAEKESGDTIKVGGIEFKTVEEKITKPSIPAPSLDRPIVFKDTSNPEANKTTENKIKEIIINLKADPLYFDGWIDLGLYRQSIGDLEGAKEAWIYSSALKPKDPLSFLNLGTLYGYYLKDNIKAEENYLKSIELEKNSGFWYYQTFIFYKDVLKDNVKAKAIIEEGVKNNPTDEDLKNILKSL